MEVAVTDHKFGCRKEYFISLVQERRQRAVRIVQEVEQDLDGMPLGSRQIIARAVIFAQDVQVVMRAAWSAVARRLSDGG